MDCRRQCRLTLHCIDVLHMCRGDQARHDTLHKLRGRQTVRRS